MKKFFWIFFATYQFNCKRTTCGFSWTASTPAGNNHCPKCGMQAHPKKIG